MQQQTMFFSTWGVFYIHANHQCFSGRQCLAMHLKDFFYFKWGLPLGVVDIIGLHAMNYVTDSQCAKLGLFCTLGVFRTHGSASWGIYAYNDKL